MTTLAYNIEHMRGVFTDIAADGETTIKVSEVRRIAKAFGLNYMSGKIAAKRANLKIVV